MSTADETTSDVLEDENEPEDRKLDLQVEINDAGPCLKHVRVIVPRDDIDFAYENAVENLTETAVVPGFRPGHVPKGLIQKRFRDDLKSKVREQLLVASLEQVAEDHNLDPINEPDLDILAIEVPDEGDFEYEFDIEVRPDFEIPDYAGLKIERPAVEVTDEEVAAHEERFLAQYGMLTPEEGPAQPGDLLTLSSRFSRNGQALHEIEEFSAKLRPVLRFRDAELENFQELFEGAEIGATKSADLTVSSEAPTIELRGETVHAEFELLDLKRLETPEMNSAFFERVGIDDEADLKKQIRQTLERQKVYRERQDARSQVLSKITESADWELPEALVTRQVENALRREILEMQQAGFTVADIRARENSLRQNAISTTRQALKEHFVLDRIAEREEIEVSESDLQQEITLMAMQQGESSRRLRARFTKSGMIENLKAQLRERKAIDYILSKADFVDIPAPPAEPIDRIEAVPYSVCSWTGTTSPAETAEGEGEQESGQE